MFTVWIKRQSIRVMCHMIVAKIFAPCSVENFYLPRIIIFIFENVEYKNIYEDEMGSWFYKHYENYSLSFFCSAQILGIKNQGSYYFFIYGILWRTNIFYNSFICSFVRIFPISCLSEIRNNHSLLYHVQWLLVVFTNNDW